MNDDSFTVNGTKQLVNVVKFTRKLGKLKGQNKEKKKGKVKKADFWRTIYSFPIFFFFIFSFLQLQLFFVVFFDSLSVGFLIAVVPLIRQYCEN